MAVRSTVRRATALLVAAALAGGAHGALGATRHPEVPIGVHSMLYLNHPFSAKEAMFKEAAELGASTIRLDIEVSAVFPDASMEPDWTGVDQDMLLARRYHLSVLADLTATPDYMADCPPGTRDSHTYMCPADPDQWAADVGEIAAHTQGVIDNFEIINEPDSGWAFLGSPEQYAWILSASYDAIHAANPAARVALGGLKNIDAIGRSWMNAVFATRGADASHKFDIANVHMRTSPEHAGEVLRSWRRYFASKGFAGPLWVTEAGYPADPAQQKDPAYRSGPRAQARWLQEAIPAMLRAGAAMVFVTERDQQAGPYASEGVLQTPDPLPADPSYTRRPSFYVVRSLARSLVVERSRDRKRRATSARRSSRPSN